MVKLESFATDKANSLNQAWALQELVAKERAWLEQVQPDTVERYSSIRSAVHTIVRIAGYRQGVKARIIRQNRAAIGIATIIPNQHIVHPVGGRFEGSDLDY